ncbi:MAG TPA: hypothetical protein VD836_01885, partial [Solirubrobacteraceae bacterium]|nr:hypothetical protein [Solirubrobacteraceae bacterium]
LAATEGIVCDPVYSGKALAAVASVPGDGPVVFWHTGGAQSVFTAEHAAALARDESPPRPDSPSSAADKVRP